MLSSRTKWRSKTEPTAISLDRAKGLILFLVTTLAKSSNRLSQIKLISVELKLNKWKLRKRRKGAVDQLLFYNLKLNKLMEDI